MSREHRVADEHHPGPWRPWRQRRVVPQAGGARDAADQPTRSRREALERARATRQRAACRSHEFGRTQRERLVHRGLHEPEVNRIIAPGRRRRIERDVRGDRHRAQPIARALLVGSRDGAKHVIAFVEGSRRVSDELEVMRGRAPHIRVDDAVLHRGPPAALHACIERAGLPRRREAERVERRGQQVCDDHVGLELALPRAHPPALRRARLDSDDSLRKAHRPTAPLDRAGHSPCELADATAHVARATEEVVERCERERRFGARGARLHRDLADRIGEQTQRWKVHLVQQATERRANESEKRQIAAGSSQVCCDHLDVERREQCRIVEQGPQCLRDSLLRGEERAQPLDRRPWQRTQRVDELLPVARHGNRHRARAQLDERIDLHRLDRDCVLLDYPVKELSRVETREQRGPGLETVAAALERAGAAAGILKRLEEQRVMAELREGQRRTEPAEARTDDDDVVHDSMRISRRAPRGRSAFPCAGAGRPRARRPRQRRGLPP